MCEGDAVSAADKDLWDYFTSLYKHSNKGIKGRGKDRRIFSVSRGHEDLKPEARSTSSDHNGSSYSDRKDSISSSNISYCELLQGTSTGNWAG